DTRPRILFLIRTYQHPEFGTQARCYVDSGTRLARTRYFENLFAAKTPAGLRIVARWRVCLACRGSGRIGANTCQTCNGTGWEWAGGGKLGDLGPVTKVERFEAPTDLVSLADYEKD